MYKADDQRYAHCQPRPAGKSGLVLPPLSLGLWHHFSASDPFASRRDLILSAFDHGVFHFDVANHYGDGDEGSSETLLGEVLAHDLRPYRDELVIATKVGYEIHPGPFGSGTSRKAVLQGIDDSLRRLQLDYVDVFYAHRFDATVPIEETVRALDSVVRAGKALYIGVSNYETPQAQAAIRLFQDLGTPFVLDQMSYNVFNRNVEDTGLLDTLRASGAGVIAYGPLAEGLLTDRYLQAIPADFPIHPTNKAIFANGMAAATQKLNDLNSIAQGRGQTLAQMALAWLLHDPIVTSVIIGTTNIQHLEDNLKAVDNTTFSADELQAIDNIVRK